MLGRQPVAHADDGCGDRGGELLAGGVVGPDVADHPAPAVEVDHDRQGLTRLRDVDTYRHIAGRSGDAPVDRRRRLVRVPGQSRQLAHQLAGLGRVHVRERGLTLGVHLVEQRSHLRIEWHGHTSLGTWAGVTDATRWARS